MRRALLVLSFAAAALVGAETARGDAQVDVGGFGFAIQGTGESGWRMAVEHFADGSRNGVRARQLGFGDPRIFSRTASCTENLFANDVVCNQVVSLVQIINGDPGRNELVVGGSNVGCEAAGETTVLVNMGGGDDSVRPAFGCGGQANVTGDNRMSPLFRGGGGAGNDSLTGGRRDDELAGDAGNDVIAGGTGDDVLAGGSGNDTITGQGGSDNLIAATGADVLDGGGQSDTLTYEVPDSVTVTLDGVANDGRSGEGANVRDVETVITRAGNDKITGSSADETLDGGAGNDTLKPGTGSDTVRGGAGDDLIDVREDNAGVRDTVTCGSGQDEVIADLADSVAVRFLIVSPKDDTACERVERFAVDDGPPGVIRTRSVKLGRDGMAALRLACPARARVTCRGSMRVADPRRLSRTLARGTLLGAPPGDGPDPAPALARRRPPRPLARRDHRDHARARRLEEGAAQHVRDRARPLARDPARRARRVGLVVGAEALAQVGLLEGHEPRGVDREDDSAPGQHRPRAEQRRLAEQDGEHAADHRVADVPVGAADDQPLRRVPRRERAPPDAEEQRHGPGDHAYPGRQQQRAQRRERPRRQRGVDEQQRGDEHGDRPGQEEDREERAEQPHHRKDAARASLSASMRLRLSLLLALAVAAALPAAATAADVPAGATWTEATIPSSDGVKLHADILRPKHLRPPRRRP